MSELKGVNWPAVPLWLGVYVIAFDLHGMLAMGVVMAASGIVMVMDAINRGVYDG